VTVSVSTFVPKPHTPFQWAGQIDRQETRDKQTYLRRHLRGDGIVFKCHDAELSFVEGVFARGDRRLAPIIETAVRLGAKFDSWSDEFRPDLWEEAFRQGNIDPHEYLRARDPDEVLPWDHIHAGIETSFLREEMENARREAMTGDCRWHGCADCGVCQDDIQNVTHPAAEPLPPLATPRRGWDHAAWIRVRMRYRKRDRSRFLSHLEVSRVFQRALRRAQIRVRFTQGFHPKPKVSFGPPMPVGYESDHEMLDAEIPGAPDLPSLVDRLNRQLPEGLRVHEARQVGRKDASVFSAIRSMTYRIHGFLLPEDAESRVRAFLGRESEIMEQLRKGKIRTVEIRTQVESMVIGNDGVEVVLRSRKEGGAKPGEILAHVLGLDEDARESLRVLKTACYLDAP
jgi:radical SAM-linked protein